MDSQPEAEQGGIGLDGEGRPMLRLGKPNIGGPSPEVAELRRELEYYRGRAIKLDEQVFQMRTLLQSGKGFSELLSVDSLLMAIMAVCRERYDVVSSAVLLQDDLDPSRVSFRVRAYHGLQDVYQDLETGIREELYLFRFPQDQGLLWQVIQQGDVFSVRNLAGRPRFRTASRQWNLEVLQSDIWVPLICGGRVLGILVLGKGRDGVSIPEDEYAFLQEIAAVAATNIDSCIKYEKNERILKNLRTLYDVNQQLANVHDFKALMIETLSSAVEALRAQKANLMLYNHESERLEIKVVWGNIPRPTRDAINDGRMETRTFALGEGVAGEAAKKRKPVRINDRTQIEQVGRNTVHCIMSVPLMYGEEVVGVITLTNKVRAEGDDVVLDSLGRFGQDDEQLMMGLADQASVNLHKARLYSDSITDRLTGLFNSRQFEERFEQLVVESQRSDQRFALVVLDVDHFKRFNDTHGHKAGDQVLIELARLLRLSVRPDSDDTTYRYGGEEFCMLLPDIDEDEVRTVTEALRARVEAHEVIYGDQTMKVTVSIGVATMPPAPSRLEMFEAADEAMYRAKRGGRNRVILAGSPESDEIGPAEPGESLRVESA